MPARTCVSTNVTLASFDVDHHFAGTRLGIGNLGNLKDLWRAEGPHDDSAHTGDYIGAIRSE